MREISLHVLDLLENSIAAGACRVLVRVVQCREQDMMEVTVEDDGCGIEEESSTVLSPFFTTKPEKRMGLGLSLFREAAERAGGGMTFSSSSLGGTAVRVHMQLGHLDRMPLGDLAATLGVIVATTPDIDITCELEIDGRKEKICTSQLRAQIPSGPGANLTVMKQLSQRVRQGLEGLGAEP